MPSYQPALAYAIICLHHATTMLTPPPMIRACCVRAVISLANMVHSRSGCRSQKKYVICVDATRGSKATGPVLSRHTVFFRARSAPRHFQGAAASLSVLLDLVDKSKSPGLGFSRCTDLSPPYRVGMQGMSQQTCPQNSIVEESDLPYDCANTKHQSLRSRSTVVASRF